MAGCVVGANWAISRWGIIPVGFGLMAPAGVYFAGAVFTCRDIVQNTLGRRFTLCAIVLGAGFSFLVSPTFAVASGVTFLFSEMADFLVYTPLYQRHQGRRWLLAVIPANAAGLIVDSALFLWLAFGSEASVAGLIFGKACMTVLALLILLPLRRDYVLRPA
jgi:uncharacterized PurR-regulated membrane protein YhhQ (DUF165 family)